MQQTSQPQTEPSAPLANLAHGSLELLNRLSRDSRRGNSLIVQPETPPELAQAVAPLEPPGYGLTVALSRGDDVSWSGGLRCSSRELPFQDGSFRRVLLWHVIRDGGEAELAEAGRVLHEDGVLLILGLNAAALPRHRDALQPVGRLWVGAVKRRLHDLGLVVERQYGLGLAQAWPLHMADGGWSSALLGLADLRLLWVCHRQRFEFTPLRLAEIKTGGLQAGAASSI